MTDAMRSFPCTRMRDINLACEDSYAAVVLPSILVIATFPRSSRCRWVQEDPKGRGVLSFLDY